MMLAAIPRGETVTAKYKPNHRAQLVATLVGLVDGPGGAKRARELVLNVALRGGLARRIGTPVAAHELHKRKPTAEPVPDGEGLFALPQHWAWVYLDDLAPVCQRRVRQLPLETYVPMGGEWIADRAETISNS